MILPLTTIPGRGPRSRSEPRPWHWPNVVARWRRSAIDPRRRRPKGVLPLWTRGRRLLWSWWPWALVCIWTATSARWGWSVGTGVMAAISYLIAPPAPPPRYGLDHEFAIDSDEFLPTMAGATGVPFVAGNQVELLNNGDAFYPRMLDEIAARRAIDHDRGVHLLGRRHRTSIRRGAQREGQGRRHGQDSARRDRLGDDRHGDPRRCSRRAVRGRVVQPDSLVHDRPLQQPDASQVADHRRHASATPAAPASRITGWATRRIPTTGATCRSASQGPGVIAAANRIRAELAARPPAS